jgi:hypothetical protein
VLEWRHLPQDKRAHEEDGGQDEQSLRGRDGAPSGIHKVTSSHNVNTRETVFQAKTVVTRRLRSKPLPKRILSAITIYQ